MLTYIARRIVYSIPVLVFASFITFCFMRIAFDPLSRFRLSKGAATVIPQQRKRLGLDHPLVVQWWNWFTKAVRGNLGISERTNNEVLGELIHRLGTTIHLIVWSTLLSAAVAIGDRRVLRGQAVLDRRLRVHRHLLHRSRDAAVLVRADGDRAARHVAGHPLPPEPPDRLLDWSPLHRQVGHQPRLLPTSRVTGDDADGSEHRVVEPVRARVDARRALGRLRAHRARQGRSAAAR